MLKELPRVIVAPDVSVPDVTSPEFGPDKKCPDTLEMPPLKWFEFITVKLVSLFLHFILTLDHGLVRQL